MRGPSDGSGRNKVWNFTSSVFITVSNADTLSHYLESSLIRIASSCPVSSVPVCSYGRVNTGDLGAEVVFRMDESSIYVSPHWFGIAHAHGHLPIPFPLRSYFTFIVCLLRHTALRTCFHSVHC